MVDCWRFMGTAGLFFLVLSANAAADSLCPSPLAEAELGGHFSRLASQQLLLDFGPGSVKSIEVVETALVSPDLWRVTAKAVYRKPGREDASERHITGWVSRCHGTAVVGNNTWLANGKLAAPRFNAADLAGDGVWLGREDAPMKVIAFVDSRCSQCHRLISYARQLVAEGKLRIQLRQVAYLEEPQQAVQDTRLPETAMVKGKRARVATEDYLDMLAVFNNDEPLDRDTAAYEKALDLIHTNTRTAKERLQVDNVPGVLRYEPEYQAYRVTGYWEMNRLFQPDL